MENIEKIRHSLAHLLASSVMEFYPKAKLAIGPVIENGFYYDIDLPENFSINDLSKIESRMKELIKENQKFSGKKISKIAAKKLFKNQPYKLELIKEIKDKKVSVYQNGKFLDLCRGGHIKNTKEINPNSFKLTKIAGAYWRGNEKNKMLTRIYGIAFETEKELQSYLKMEKEAEKRDHKKLGIALDLFLFSDLVGPGLPLWTPKGTLIRNLLDEYVWELRKNLGYQKVEIPHITKRELYEKSGHWDKFQDELFNIKTREGHHFVIKPMNCPHHIQIYLRKQFSYKELPQKYANSTMCYRDEQTGELTGLSRVRSFTQDDAHIFCRQSQVKKELELIWDKIVEPFYKSFKFELKLRLSLRDPKSSKKYLGGGKIWKKMEKILQEIAEERKTKFFKSIGQAAFYGPKLDFLATDSLGREWQVATIQLDMNQPERFKLYCLDENGQKERIVMIHAAIMGSIERFMSILIEHVAGNFPLWLSPIQIAIISVSEKSSEYAGKIGQILREQNLRLEIYNQNETLGKKIREAEKQKIPYLLIVGEKEKQSGQINIRERGGKNLGLMNPEEFIERIKEEIIDKKNHG